MNPSNLDAGLIKFSLLSQLLSAVDVRVVVVSEGQLQLLQLFMAEGGSMSPARWRRVKSNLTRNIPTAFRLR